MAKIENDLYLINQKVTDLFTGASLIKFSYSGIYSLEFDLPRYVFGYNFFTIDVGTSISIFENDKDQDNFSIDDFFKIWSFTVKTATVEKDLALYILFENNYCCKIESSINDPENLVDMRWCIYQKRDEPSFFLSVTDEKSTCLQTP